MVQFYGDDEELAASVVTFLGQGLAAGGSAVIVATPAHRAAFGPALASSAAAGRLLIVDADEMLRGFLAGDRLDSAGFRAAAVDLIGRAAMAGQPVRIYAEMVALLWDAGRVTLALELEALWNDLAEWLPFALLCGYPARVLGGEDDTDAVQRVCRLHTSVTGPSASGPASGEAPAGDARGAVRGFPAHGDSARDARHFVLSRLGPWVDQALAVDAAIVTAELAANAVLHAKSPFTVTISHSPDAVRIAVRDTTPLSEGEWPATVAGHGLDVVARAAARWAVEPLPDGKVIWAELAF